MKIKPNFKILYRSVIALFLVMSVGQSALTTTAPRVIGPKPIRYTLHTGMTNPAQIGRVSAWLQQNNFDVAGMNLRLGQIEVITDESGIQLLNAKGLRGARTTGVNGTIDAFATGPDTRYLNPETAAQKLKAIAAQYPKLTHLEQIGTSLQGRPIYALLVSDTPNFKNDPNYWHKPTILFDGLHHAREIMTPEVVFDVAETLLKGSQTNVRAQQFIHNWNVWVIPMVNVDGSNLVWTKNNLWRKNARSDGSDLYGVDINRNYTYRWNGCNGSSGNQEAQDYRGGGAGSEPETKAMMNFAALIRPTASLSYHSYSELVLWPIGCRGEFASEKQMYDQIGHALADKLPSDSGSAKYTAGTPWEIIYPVDGDSMDFMYAAFGSLSFTFEINQNFQPPYALREPTLAKHRVAWGYFMNLIDKNLLTVKVVDGRSGKNAEAVMGVSTIHSSKGELPFKTNTFGYYFKVLQPGSYAISAQLADGRNAQAQVEMKGGAQQITLTIP